MNDYPTEITDDREHRMGLFAGANPTRNAASALAAWERDPAATILTNGAAYLVYKDAIAVAKGWRQTSPEELEAALKAA